MIIDAFVLVPYMDDTPRKECNDCLGCPYLKSITLNSSHKVYIECDLDENEILSLVTQAKQTLEVLDESKGNNSTFIKNRVLGILEQALKELEND